MKLFDHLPHGTVTLIVILAGTFLIYQSGALNKAVSIAEDAANHNSEGVLRAHDSFKKQIDSKDEQILVSKANLAKLAHSLFTLRAQNDSLKVNLSQAKTPEDVINAQHDIIINVNEQNDSLAHKCNILGSIVTTCEGEKLLMKARIDTLETSLGIQLASTKCHILIIFGCPTRAASAEIGVGVGATLALILTAIFGH